MPRPNRRIKILTTAGIVAVGLLVAGVLIVRRDSDPGTSPSTESRPVAPSTDPSEIPLETPQRSTEPVSSLPPHDPRFPALGPSRFPSSACSPGVSNAKYVATNGKDTNPGTKDAPFLTVAQGAQSLRHGETLFIRSGRYYNLSPSGERDGLIELHNRGKGSDTSWLTICAYPGERPMIIANDTDSGAVVVRGTDHVHIEGLEIIGPAFGRSVSPPRGAHAPGVWLGQFPHHASEANHSRIWNNWIHGFGSSGIQLNMSNNTDIRGNLIWDNADWSDFATSGISLFWPSSGTGNDRFGYGNYVVGNLLWDNYMDDSLYDPKSPFGLTDGNCIIVDENGHYTDRSQSRTLIRNNICVSNGGPAVALSRSANVEITNNTFYHNNRTTLQTVVKNGEFMCQGMQRRATIEGRSVFTKCDNIKFADNVVVGRPDRPNLFSTYFDYDVEFNGNVWVKSAFKPASSSDIALASDTVVIRGPNLTDPRDGDWSTVGPGEGKGARWPLDPR